MSSENNTKEQVHVEDLNIEIEGARVHNLKNVSLNIPRNKLVVFTGLSGSGKSSLAFDTIYAEGQRRYIETFSAYARQFLGNLERPDVDRIAGLSPVISIEQKTINKNPRSTVGTITEIYDYLRLLYARCGEAFSRVSGDKMVKYTDDQILNLILQGFTDKKIILLAPLIKGRKGHYRDLFEQIRKQGYSKVRVDGEIQNIEPGMKLDRYKVHDIEVVVDRIAGTKSEKKRMSKSIELAIKLGNGTMLVFDPESNEVRTFSKFLMCPKSGISYRDPEPNLFSFNSPYGACKKCNGIGETPVVDIDKIIPDRTLSVKKGAIAPLGKNTNSWIIKQIEALLAVHNFTLTTPLKDMSDEIVNQILYGSNEYLKVTSVTGANEVVSSFEGVISFVSRSLQNAETKAAQRWAQSFMNRLPCKACNGLRLQEDALQFRIVGKNIAELAIMDISELSNFLSDVESKLTEKQLTIGREILKEIKSRISFLLNVGLEYLTLNRSSRTLSGGEAQRIRLATQIGSELTNVLYILDEPSIGLHQRDNSRLINSLKKLRDTGNSVLVVEHDKEMMESSDHIVDIGPGAGAEGGQVVSQGTYEQIIKDQSLTVSYLNGALSIPVPKKRRKGSGKNLVLKGASGNNLKNVELKLPLETIICITGVSGSGKSTLINQTLYPILNQHFYRGVKTPLAYKSIDGLEYLDKVIEVDQAPIGRTPRSNPATYTGVFTDIRALFASLPEAKIRGYKPGRFSFNVKGGRCETCKGAGLRTIEMNFLPDVYVKCETCQGKRYNRETLEVRFKGKSISNVLNMTINNACDFFENVPHIRNRILALQSVGLGYLTLGQPSTTLSGGEAQRVKLATELAKKETGKTLYIFDEPTTGLHFEDIRLLLGILNKLADNGNTILIIEHNLDIIRVVDHIIDIGPEGGKEGGTILCSGTPEKVAKSKKSHTAKYLKDELSV